MVSIIIPAFNEERELGKCLGSLVQQETTFPFEIIIVDNNSTDQTAAIAASFSTKAKVRVIHEPRQGRGQARHSGFRAANGEVLVSSDADTEFPAGWLQTIVDALQKYTSVAAAGPARVKDMPPFLTWLFNFAQPFSARAYRLFFGHYWLPGFNFAIKREVYFEAGEFDPAMDALEDNDLAWRVRKRGTIIFVREAAVVFSGRRFHKGFWRGMFEYVVAFVKYFVFNNKRIHWSNIR